MSFLNVRKFRKRCYEILDVGSTHDYFSVFVHRLLIAVILFSVCCVILESVPNYINNYGLFFHIADWSVAFIFLVEYVFRLFSIPEHAPFYELSPWRARLKYALTPIMLIDLITIFPLLFLFNGSEFLRIFLLLRLLRFFKLLRYSTAINSLLDAVRGEQRALLACMLIFGCLIILAASIMHMVEMEAQPEQFGTIPGAMYWAAITLTTVGYGDIHPITPLGKLVASFTAFFGVLMLSLPIGIIATAFSEAIHKRDFVVTWNMVARVPLFVSLSAGEIALILQYLRSRSFESGQIIVRRGELAHSMYFISSGSVELELPVNRVRLDEGQFFGEAAILQEGHRSATVRALSSCKLLVLDRDDFLYLMEQNTKIAEHIHQIVIKRSGLNPIENAGDITSSEIADKK